MHTPRPTKPAPGLQSPPPPPPQTQAGRGAACTAGDAPPQSPRAAACDGARPPLHPGSGLGVVGSPAPGAARGLCCVLHPGFGRPVGPDSPCVPGTVVCTSAQPRGLGVTAGGCGHGFPKPALSGSPAGLGLDRVAGRRQAVCSVPEGALACPPTGRPTGRAFPPRGAHRGAGCSAAVGRTGVSRTRRRPPEDDDRPQAAALAQLQSGATEGCSLPDTHHDSPVPQNQRQFLTHPPSPPGPE